MSKRKILLLASLLCMIAILAVGGTLAYFTDEKTATNTFTVGNVEIELTEPAWDSSGSKDAPQVYPGEALAKDPTVKNVGANPCFVRIRVTGLDCLAPAGMITYRTQFKPGMPGDGWELYDDGLFYYTKVLAVGEKTTPVFDSIVIPTDLTNGDGRTFAIDVQAEAVQAQGAKSSFSDVEKMTVTEIAGWFTTCMPKQ